MPPPVYGSPSISFSLTHNRSPITLLLRDAPTSALTTYCVCVQILWIDGKAWDSVTLRVPAWVPATYIPTSLKLPSSHSGSSAHLTNCTGHLSRSQVPQVCFLSEPWVRVRSLGVLALEAPLRLPSPGSLLFSSLLCFNILVQIPLHQLNPSKPSRFILLLFPIFYFLNIFVA